MFSRVLAPRDLAQLDVMAFNQPAATTAHIDSIKTAEVEKALLHDVDFPVHESLLAGSRAVCTESFVARQNATPSMPTGTADAHCFFRMQRKIYFYCGDE
jgi:hypothetical protein